MFNMCTEVDHHDVSEVVQAHRKFRWEFVAAFLGLRKQSGRSKRLKSKCQTQLQRPSHFDTKSSCSRVLMPLALVDRADDRGADVPECSSMPCGLEIRYERTTSSFPIGRRGGSSRRTSSAPSRPLGPAVKRQSSCCALKRHAAHLCLNPNRLLDRRTCFHQLLCHVALGPRRKGGQAHELEDQALSVAGGVTMSSRKATSW